MRRLAIGTAVLVLSPVSASWATGSLEVACLVGLGWLGWVLMLAGKREVTAGLVGPRMQVFDPPETSLPRNVWSAEQLESMAPKGWALETELSVPPPRTAVPSARARRSAWRCLLAGATAAFLILVPFVTGVGATSVLAWVAVLAFVFFWATSGDHLLTEWRSFEAHSATVSLMGAAPGRLIESWISGPGGEGAPPTEAWRFEYETPESGATSVVIEGPEGTYGKGHLSTVLYLPFQAPWPSEGESALVYDDSAARATDTSGRLYSRFIDPDSTNRRVLRPTTPNPPRPRSWTVVLTGLAAATAVAGIGYLLAVGRKDDEVIMIHAWIVAAGVLGWWTRGWVEDQMTWRVKKNMEGRGRLIQAVVVYSDFVEGLDGLAVFQFVIGRKLYTACQRHFDRELRSGDRKIAFYSPEDPTEAILVGVKDYRRP